MTARWFGVTLGLRAQSCVPRVPDDIGVLEAGPPERAPQAGSLGRACPNFSVTSVGAQVLGTVSDVLTVQFYWTSICSQVLIID